MTIKTRQQKEIKFNNGFKDYNVYILSINNEDIIYTSDIDYLNKFIINLLKKGYYNEKRKITNN